MWLGLPQGLVQKVAPKGAKFSLEVIGCSLGPKGGGVWEGWGIGSLLGGMGPVLGKHWKVTANFAMVKANLASGFSSKRAAVDQALGSPYHS